MSLTTMTEFTETLSDIVKTDKQKWKETAFTRAVSDALAALSRDKPLLDDAVLTLVADQRKYDLPSDCLKFISSDWGTVPMLEAYDAQFPGVLPRIYSQNSSSGKQLVFSPAPSQRFIAVYGAAFNYEHSSQHVFTDDVCTISDEDEELLLTAALIALMRDLMAANVSSPIQLHRGMNSVPSNSTPTSIHRALVLRYEELLRC